MARGSFEYLQNLPLYATEKPYEILVPLTLFPNADVPRTNLQFETAQVDVKDIRGHQDDFSLDKNGFAVFQHPAPVAAEDLQDRETIEKNYIPTAEALVRKEVKGVKRVVPFDWRVRRSINPIEFSKRTLDLEDGLDALQPAVHPHVDQSANAALQRVKMHLGEEAEELLKGRVRIINVWRPLHTIRSWPLALCDTQSVARTDLVNADIIRRRYIGETLFGVHNPKHRWHYLSDQTTDEVTMIKIFDSSPEAEAKCCMHASFQLSEEDAKIPRESIEVRTLVFSDE